MNKAYEDLLYIICLTVTTNQDNYQICQTYKINDTENYQN